MRTAPRAAVWQYLPLIFLWLKTELDLDAFIPREETFSEISPVVIVWS